MNNKLKTLVAASSLALSAGYAHSTVYNVDADIAGLVVGCSACTSNAVGSGTYDDVTNTLSLSILETAFIDFQDGSGQFNAAIGRDVEFLLNGPSGTTTATSCDAGADPVSNQVICTSAANVIGATTDLGYVNQDFTTSGGPAFTLDTALGEQTTFFSRLETIDRQWVITMGDVAPEVPVPAAAWLFGSALLGLGGVARKRR